MTKRIEKVNSLLEHELSKIIAKDFTVAGVLVTLTQVEATPNLIEARAYVSVFPEDKAERLVKMLNKGVYSIQKEINKKLNMRPIPKIIFLKDSKIQEAAKVEALLEKLKNT